MPGDLRERLRRLRREEAPAEPARREPLPAWLAERLARTSGPRVAPDDGRERSLEPPRGVEECAGPLGPVHARLTTLAADDAHGDWRLAEALDADTGAFELLTRGRARGPLDARHAVFLDVETTGLSGGAGTHVFLVGLGAFAGGSFRVEQVFLRGPEEEQAFLAAVSERIRAGSALVTFCGKSFDRHRLEDRMRVCRLEAPFAGRPHLDLYYAARALYREAFADSRLATLEAELGGVRRVRDLPGSFAPAAWLDFLAGRPHLLEEVFRHNLDDVLSLVALYAHLGRALADGRSDGRALEPRGRAGALRALSLARLCAARRDWSRALDWHGRAEELEPSVGRAGAALLERARWLRRAGRERLDASRGGVRRAEASSQVGGDVLAEDVLDRQAPEYS